MVTRIKAKDYLKKPKDIVEEILELQLGIHKENTQIQKEIRELIKIKKAILKAKQEAVKKDLYQERKQIRVKFKEFKENEGS